MLRLAPALWAIIVAAIPAVLAQPIQAADPLDYMPNSVRLVAVVDHPRKLAETLTQLDAIKQAQTLPQYQQLYDSPAARRIFKLLEYAEKELGAEWPELLDQLAGNGLALGLQIGADPAPGIAVVSGTDAKQSERAFDLAIRTINAEMAREGSKDRLVPERQGDVTRAHIGNDVHFARIDSVIIACTNAEMLTEAITQAKGAPDGVARKARSESRKVLPKDPLAWVWLNFAMLKQTKSGMDFFDTSRMNFILTIVAGSTIDCLKRSDFVAAGLYQEANEFRLRVRLPAGRDGLWEDLALHIPPKEAPGSLPLLDPPGTIYSQSFHLDIGYVWKHRERLIGDEQMLKQLEEGQKAASKFLPASVPIGELLEMWGPYHRIVVVDHDQRPYKTEPGLKLPAFGYVATMRDKKFGESVEAIARAAAVIGVLQFGMKSMEVQFEGTTIVGYRFPENKELADDPQGIRYNFEPCFARVGDELIVASTIELAKKLVAELKKPRRQPSTAVWRGQVSAGNGAAVISAEPDALITDSVLSRGVGLAEARKDVAKLVDWVRTLGVVRIEIDLTASEYRLDIVWTPGKK
jgi:hypothetical protein